MEKITLFCLMLLCSTVFGQAVNRSKKDTEERASHIIKSAKYIFEGSPIKGSYLAYFNADSSETYGSVVWNVYRVYKGDLKIGTVQVFSKDVGVSYRKNGQLHSVQFSNHSDIPSVNYGERGIIFANDTDFPSHPTKIVSVVNPQKISLFGFEGGCIVGLSDNGKFEGPIFGLEFETEKDVYNYLRSFPGVNIPDSVYAKASATNKYMEETKQRESDKQPKIVEVQVKTTEDKINDKIAYYKQLLFRYDLLEQHRHENHTKDIAEAKKQVQYWSDKLERYKKKEITESELEIILNNENTTLQSLTGKVASNTGRIATSPDFTWHVSNQKFTGLNSYYEFDVLGKVNQSGIYLDWVDFYFDYNTSLFGASIVANSKITVTNGSLYSTATYSVGNFDVDNNTTTIAFFASTPNTGPTKSARLMAADTEELLFHVKIQLTSTACNVNTGLIYNTAAMNADLPYNTYGLDANISASTPFNSLLTVPFTSLNTCQISIATITQSATPLIAGKNHTITITGNNFGATRGSGKVQFKNADNGGMGTDLVAYLPGLDNFDYVNWSDNSITVKVPSRVGEGGDAPSAGTGKIKIVNSQGGAVESDDEILIKYSLESLVDTAFAAKYPYYLRNQDASGGITFRLGTGISNNAAAKTAIQQALNEWSCNLGLDLKLGTDVSTGGGRDGQNVIYLSSSLGTALMQTSVKQTSCGATIPGVPGGANNASTYDEFDIAINSTINYQYETQNDLSSGKYDFYSAILHEIGHALGVRHVIDPTDLMWYQGSLGPLGSSNRKTVHTCPTVQLASSDVVTTSKKVTWSCVRGTEITRTLTGSILPLTCTGLVTGINDHVDIINTTALFNPGDYASYTGRFYSKDGTTYPTQWNWSLKLYYGGGAYNYASTTVNTTLQSGNDNTWSFSSTSLPDYDWVRTEAGWIYGQLSVYTIDNHGYKNYSTVQNVEVRFKPNKPVISHYNVLSGIVYFTYNAPGATSYNVYYDTDPTAPYTGTGASEGNSPINAGTNVSYTLSNLSLSSKSYAVTIIGTNSAGSSVYSDPLYLLPPAGSVVGSTINNPINAGTITATSAFTDTKSNTTFYEFGNDYTGSDNQISDDIFYRFYVPATSNIIFTTQNSGIDTYIHLLNASGALITSNDDFPGATYSYINTTLQAGYYYLVVEGYSYNNGLITSKISVANKIVWTDLVNVSASDNTITKTNTSYLWNAGAASSNVIPPYADGWIEMEINNINWDIMFGLSSNNVDASWNTIEYNCYISRRNGAKTLIYKLGAQLSADAGPFAVGDKFRVERVSGTINFKRNNVVIYSTAGNSAEALRADVSLFDPSSKIYNAYCSHAGSPQGRNITVSNLSVGSYSKDSIQTYYKKFETLYPNPTSGKFSVNYQNHEQEKVYVKIVNPIGIKIYDQVWYPQNSSYQLPIDLTNQASGLYIIYINDEIYKLIKE